MMDNKQFTIVFMPNGTPAPAVLTTEEVVLLLRLDGEHPERTLKYYRDEGLLEGVRLGRKIRYTLDEVMRFLANKTEQRPA